MANSVRTPAIIGHLLRRAAFFALVTLTTLIALGLLVSVFHTDGLSPIELLLLLLYTILFSWICISFWTAFMGFFVILFGRDRWAISRQPAAPPDPATSSPRTAIRRSRCLAMPRRWRKKSSPRYPTAPTASCCIAIRG